MVVKRPLLWNLYAALSNLQAVAGRIAVPQIPLGTPGLAQVLCLPYYDISVDENSDLIYVEVISSSMSHDLVRSSKYCSWV